MSREKLHDLQAAVGARFAPDGIPLEYGDLRREYQAALDHVVLMDRSHEGRLELSGRDHLAIPHRLSTNDLESLHEGDRRATIFTNPNGRIIDRVTVYHRGETALMLTEPGRGEAVRSYLQRNIFFSDDMRITDLQPTTAQFTLHGTKADVVIDSLGGVMRDSANIEIAGVRVFVGRDVPLSGAHWRIIVPLDRADHAWTALLKAGAPHGIIPAGSLTYNVLRIRAGRPGVMRELSSDYIPLEVGLWDEISFTKGCYTGQEIIARMESRRRLAKTSVSVQLERYVEAPASVTLNGREVGKMTSSVQTPDGDAFGIAVVKLSAAKVGTAVIIGGVSGTISAFTGVQPVDLIKD